jgi:LmbE family N-acetylglucosaminyl deacetylase
MSVPVRDLDGRSLLAVFAHPDDESLACGGLLAWCAERGARVTLLCLTHGEHGPERRAGRGDDGDARAAPARLGEVRARELEAAARVLGIGEVLLLHHEDGMLPWLDGARLEADVLAAMRRARPDVVVTFDDDGLYWHPDHIAVHERVTAAVARLGASAPALRYVSLPEGAMRALVDADAAHPGRARDMPAATATARRPSRGADDGALFGIAAVDAFGDQAREPTLVVHAGPLAARKLEALRCHRSQVAGSAIDRLDEAGAVRFLGTEHLRAATVGARGAAFIDSLGAPYAPAVA